MLMAGAFLIAALLVVVEVGFVRDGNPGAPPAGLLYTTVNETVSVGAPVGYHGANPFFAVVFTDSFQSTSTLEAVGAYLNTTPITWFRFGGIGDQYDPTTGIYYAPGPGGGVYLPHYNPTAWNFSWMKSWCYSRTPRCDWLGYLPGQENDTQAAVHAAEWYHEVLGFVPNLWQFGNEPDHWTHYGLNRSSWSTTDNLTVSGPAYATMVRDYLAAVAALYPSDQYVGIEASGASDYQNYIADTAATNGLSLSAMAYHTYPGFPGTNTLAEFFAPLASPASVTGTMAGMRHEVTVDCASCASIPIQIGEFQSPPLDIGSPFEYQYPTVPFLAASVVQALEANVSMFTVYDSQQLYNYTTGTLHPEGYLYQRIFENLTMGNDESVTFSGGVGGLYGIETANGASRSLLVVNTNLSHALNLTVALSDLPMGGTGTYWSWGPGETAPTSTSVSALPGTYAVPPEGLLLITAPNVTTPLGAAVAP